jgi:hypothetical protein
MGGAIRSILSYVVVFATIMLADLAIAPDPVRGANAPGQFDALAARARLARVLGDETPHPVDSVREDALRERLLGEIRALGYAPEIRDAFSCHGDTHGPYVACAQVRNIVFSAGPASGPAVLAAAHYDSVPAGPGASDDGIGVAVWLQIAAQIKAAPLRRRVVFLITDGEEAGLLGAEAFARSDPVYASVQAVVNLEARGTRGLAPFFETNQPNADAIRAYAAGATRPLANSIMADIYSLLPNSTDVAVLRRPGLDIVNMALIDGIENYHTPRDSIASQDLGSVQHMGDQAMATLNAFALHADGGSGETLVFTDIATRAFLVLPATLSMAALGVCAVVALIFFWRQTPPPRWRGLLLPLAALVATAALAFALGFVFNALKAGYWHAHPEFTRAWTALSAMAVLSALLLSFGRRLSGASLGGAAITWFSLIGFLGSIALSGLSILFLPVAAIYALGAVISLAWRPALAIGSVLAAIVVLAFWTPLLALFETTFGYDLPLVEALVVVLIMLPCVGLLTPQTGRRWPALATGIAAMAALIGAALTPSFSELRPHALNVTYVEDEDAHAGYIVAGSAHFALPPAVAHMAPFAPAQVFPWDKRRSWTAPGRLQNLAASDATVISTASAGGKRVVRLRLAPNGAYATVLRIPIGAHPESVVMNGASTAFAKPTADDDFAIISCVGRACADATMDVTLPANGAHEPWYVSGSTLGVTQATAAIAAARPNWAVPIQLGDTALTFKKLRLEEYSSR